MTEAPVKVYGSASKFRSDLQRRLGTARELLDRLDAGRDRLRQAPIAPADAKGLARALYELEHTGPITEVEEATTRWLIGNDRLIGRYLGAGADDFKFYEPQRRTLSSPGHGMAGRQPRPDGATRADACEKTITSATARLQRLLERLPAAAPAITDTVDRRFTELRQTRLVEESVLNAYIKRMSTTRTKVQMSNAIGTAKELVEACNRATLDLLGVGYDPKDDFGKLGKAVRGALRSRDSAPSPKSAAALDQLFAGMATVEQALAAIRNDLGTGHGRTRLPKDLRPRHAQLAIDVADTYVRYLVATLTDLKLI